MLEVIGNKIPEQHISNMHLFCKHVYEKRKYLL